MTPSTTYQCQKVTKKSSTNLLVFIQILLRQVNLSLFQRSVSLLAFHVQSSINVKPAIYESNPQHYNEMTPHRHLWSTARHLSLQFHQLLRVFSIQLSPVHSTDTQLSSTLQQQCQDLHLLQDITSHLIPLASTLCLVCIVVAQILRAPALQ